MCNSVLLGWQRQRVKGICMYEQVLTRTEHVQHWVNCLAGQAQTGISLVSQMVIYKFRAFVW